MIRNVNSSKLYSLDLIIYTQGRSKKLMIRVKNDKFWDSTSFIQVDKENIRPVISKAIQKELTEEWMYIGS